jgi:hypothetical protein
VFWIQIGINADPDAYQDADVYPDADFDADPDPDPGF